MLLGLVFVPLAQAEARRASVVVNPAVFSSTVGSLQIDAALVQAAPLGLQVVSQGGALVGWLTPERPRATVRFAWRGMLAGRLLPDGGYRVRLVSRGQRVAEAGFRVDRTAPRLTGLRVDNGGAPYARDWRLLTTVTPNGDGLRDHANIRFSLSEPATVLFEALVATRATKPVFAEQLDLPAGPGSITWTPPSDLGARTYVTRLTLVDGAGNRRLVGRSRAGGTGLRGPIVRVQGVDAAFGRISYAPGELALLQVATDAGAFDLQLFRVGNEQVETPSDNTMNGIAVGPPATVNWEGRGSAPGQVKVNLAGLANGLYFAQLTAVDGRTGYAPFVVRPLRPGVNRVAIVLPTTTWQAYNFFDADGNGWGDTWYAGGPRQTIELGRPFLRRGVPPFFRRYDLPFLRWLSANGYEVDVLTDDEVETATAADLAAAYDLIVFPGHHEYVTDRELTAITGYRDRGGNLMFLSANNFFWRVERNGDTIRRTRQWRNIGKPESALIGVQYRGNDEGARQAPFLVRDTASVPWLWQGTGLTVGSTLGADIGGYGTEIDGTTAFSPPGTIVLAEVPDLFGPGKTAQMTYYETAAGARVFAAGTLDFGGSINHQPQATLLQNLWARLSQP